MQGYGAISDPLMRVRVQRVPTEKAKLILTDVDNTLLDFSASFDAWMRAEGFRKREDTEDQYSLASAYGMPERRITALVMRFYDLDAAYNLAPHRCAHGALPALYEAGYRFVAISACPAGKAVAKRRKANLESAFGVPFQGVMCLGLGADKRGALRSHKPSVWVEDHAHHAGRGAQAGHRTFLLSRPYNLADALPAGVSRVPDWHAIASALIDNKGIIA